MKQAKEQYESPIMRISSVRQIGDIAGIPEDEIVSLGDNEGEFIWPTSA